MKKLLLSALALSILNQASAITPIYSQDFQGTGIPAGWSQTTLATDGGWNFGTATALSSQYWAISTTNATKIAATNDDDCNCDKSNDLLKSPAINLTSNAFAQLSVDYFHGAGTYSGSTEVGTIEVSLDGGTTWTVLQTLAGVADWTTLVVDLTPYVGQASVTIGFRYNDDGGWMFGYAIDNFNVYEPDPYEASMVSFTNYQYKVGPANFTMTGQFKNNGGNPITTIDLKYSDGTSTYTQNLTGLNVLPGASYTYNHSTPFTAAAGSTNNIQVWIELAGDADQTNDTLGRTLYGLTSAAAKHVLGEEATGTWCGWCPRGAVYMETMANTYPTTWHGVAVHNSDPMTVSAYDSRIGAMIGGYPSGLLDRDQLDVDPSDFPAQYAVQVQKIVPASITTTSTYDQITRAMTVTVTATWTSNMDNVDMNLAAIVVEDDVTGTSSGYNQNNYYSSASQNIPLNGAGHNWQTEPATVPAASMTYDHVGRALLGGFDGQAGSVPATVTNGGTTSYTFNHNLPAAQDPTQIKVLGLLIQNETGVVINSGESQLVLGVEDETANFDFTVYPNPANDLVNIQLNLVQSGEVSITVVNIAGAVVTSANHGTLTGANTFAIDGSKLESGIYFINIAVNGEVMTKKLVVTH